MSNPFEGPWEQAVADEDWSEAERYQRQAELADRGNPDSSEFSLETEALNPPE